VKCRLRGGRNVFGKGRIEQQPVQPAEFGVREFVDAAFQKLFASSAGVVDSSFPRRRGRVDRAVD
jgi:hypothetical protein